MLRTVIKCIQFITKLFQMNLLSEISIYIKTLYASIFSVTGTNKSFILSNCDTMHNKKYTRARKTISWKRNFLKILIFIIIPTLILSFMLSRLILIFLVYDQILITVKNFKIIQNLLFLHLISSRESHS